MACSRDQGSGWRGAALRTRRRATPSPTARAATRGQVQYLGGTRAQSGETVAFVLQGGGSLTAVQVGMLWALTEAGITPDLLIGASAGALNAVAYAGDPTVAGLSRLESLWLSLRRKSVAPLSARGLLGGLTGREDGLVSNTALRSVIGRGTPIHDLQDTAIPVHVVATDLATGAPVVLSEGDAVTALLASSAYPGIYPPVTIGQLHLIDGGVSADTPLLQAEVLGATSSYVLPAAIASDGPDAHHGPLPVAVRALTHLLDGSGRRDVEHARNTVHVLPTPTTDSLNPLDFRDTARLIDDGYSLATRWLSERFVTGIDLTDLSHSEAVPDATEVDELVSPN